MEGIYTTSCTGAGTVVLGGEKSGVLVETDLYKINHATIYVNNAVNEAFHNNYFWATKDETERVGLAVRVSTS